MESKKMRDSNFYEQLKKDVKKALKAHNNLYSEYHSCSLICDFVYHYLTDVYYYSQRDLFLYGKEIVGLVDSYFCNL